MSSLQPIGVCNYNGFEFSEMANTRMASVRLVKSADGRTISYAEITLEIEDVLSAGTATDAVSAESLQRLSAPAAPLRYDGRGTNPIIINTGPNLPYDVKWGPFPMMLEWDIQGGGTSIKFTWRVEVAIPVCAGATYLGTQSPMEFAYKLDYDIDRGGYTTARRHSGFVEIPITRLTPGSRIPYTSADAWREKINPPVIAGFRRIPGKFTLSMDRRRLDFEIVDEQLLSGTNALPVGCIEADASHSYTSAPNKDQYWNSTLTGTYEIAAGLPMGVAETAFAEALKDRLNNARAKFPDPGAAIWLNQFTAVEMKIYGKPTLHLSCSYLVILATFRDILDNGGLFRPVPGSNPGLWAASVAKILGSRGISGLAFDPSKDAIVDLCVGGDGATTGAGGYPSNQNAVPNNGNQQTVSTAIQAVFPPPSSARSWLDYVAFLTVEEDSGVVIGSTLPTSPLITGKNSGAWQPLVGSGLPVSGVLESTFFPQAADVSLSGQQGTRNSPPNTTFAQQRTGPVVYVILHGYAIRGGGYQIPIPQLLQIGGMTAVPCNRSDCGEGFEQARIGSLNGAPLNLAKFRLRYVLQSTPMGPFVVPANPLFPNA